jgi:uncharacterized membrane protein
LKIGSFKNLTDTLENKIGLDLAHILIIAVLCLIFVLVLPDGNVLRILFGLPFLLILPGYSLVSVLWTRKTELDMLERVALSLGLSIAIVALVGLALNYTPMGITLNSVLFTIFGLILVLIGLTRFRRLQLKPEERFKFNPYHIFYKMDVISQTDKLIAMVVVVVIIVGGSLLIYIAMNPPQEQFTELFILDENEETENYPFNLDVNQSASIYIVVVNHEQNTIDYNIIVWLRSENITDEILEEYNFSLNNDKEWRHNFIFSINVSELFKLEIELYKENEANPYTTNHLWIDVKD